MATKYRNTDKRKPQIIQTQSSTSVDPKLNKATQIRRDKDNVRNVSVGIYDVDSAFKNFLETKVNNTISDNGNLISVCDKINTNLLNFCKNAVLNTPEGDIPSGFKFGYQGQEPLTFLDLHYVNPEADPDDKSTWVYTKLPAEK